MSGLVKAKKYDWKDSNMALFGTDTEKQVKKESAETEPAWQGSGQNVGLQIWRIVKFKVTSWPKEDYGKFYDGDSYIILNTYKEEEGDELLYDVHFWIGKYSSQDEYGTAAYKTVELDTFLDDKPIQHREVQCHESPLFKTYFPEITYLKGGADTGFRRVQPEEYKPRLFHIQRQGPRKVVSTQVALSRANLNSGDVFILDLGLTLYQWNGSECNKDEKFKATQIMQQICSERGGKPNKEVVEEEDVRESHPFYEALTEDQDEDDQPDSAYEGPAEMKKVCDADGSLDLEDVEGEISADKLCSTDVYIINTTKECFVWIGREASVDERRNALPYAHKYLQDTDCIYLPISVFCQGDEKRCPGFIDAVAGCA